LFHAVLIFQLSSLYILGAAYIYIYAWIELILAARRALDRYWNKAYETQFPTNQLISNSRRPSANFGPHTTSSIQKPRVGAPWASNICFRRRKTFATFALKHTHVYTSENAYAFLIFALWLIHECIIYKCDSAQSLSAPKHTQQTAGNKVYERASMEKNTRQTARVLYLTLRTWICWFCLVLMQNLYELLVD